MYDRNFLRMWSYCWLACFGSMAALGLVTLQGVNTTSIFRHGTSYVAIVTNMFQVFFLVLGSYRLGRQHPTKSNALFVWSVIILLVGLFIMCVVGFEHETANARYMMRVGGRYLTASVGFSWAGILVVQSPQISKGIGKGLMSFSFFSYGILNLYYFLVVIANALSNPIGFPFFFGLIDIIVICLVGLSMIIWLLEDERDRLLKTNNELDSFLYSTSHDLRAPISSILGLINLAKYEVNDDIGKKYFAMIEKQLNKLDDVISDILNLAKSKKTELKFEQIDFNDLVKDVFEDFRFAKNAGSIQLEYTPQRGNVILGDYYLMKTVLSNLIGNAIKYHNLQQTNPYIRVHFRRNSEVVTINIKDNGQGIAPEAIPKIFDMFYRANLTVRGTGLGLYIVRESLLKMNGKITVNSIYGEGSNFVVTLTKV